MNAPNSKYTTTSTRRKMSTVLASIRDRLDWLTRAHEDGNGEDLGYHARHIAEDARWIQSVTGEE